MRTHRIVTALVLSTALACGGGDGDEGQSETETEEPELDEWDQRLADREVNYPAALRTAALRLTGDLPSLADTKTIGLAPAAEQKDIYESLIRGYLDDPRFSVQMIRFWRDAFKMGGSAMLNAAPNFAAQLTVEGRPYTELFTAASGACPTYTAEGGFVAADCGGGAPVPAGVLTNPGAMAHFASPMAFRRVRWVQETFACTAFPTEGKSAAEIEEDGAADDGLAAYTSPWPIESISGALNGGSVDFHDRESVACANCHSTMNHLAPLFGNYDEDGNYQAGIQVVTPTDGNPVTLRTDWLPDGEETAWRLGMPAADPGALGAAMASDVAVSECAVARTWNWALGRGDIVEALALVPADVIEAQLNGFVQSNYNLKELIFTVFTAEDFISY